MSVSYNKFIDFYIKGGNLINGYSFRVDGNCLLNGINYNSIVNTISGNIYDIYNNKLPYYNLYLNSLSGSISSQNNINKQYFNT